jgi:UDP-N-acetylglucosamine transferase subunit ALG13
LIFATLGTHGHPFRRFLDALAELGDDVVVQYGHNPRPDWARRAEAFLPFDEVVALMEAADAVVTHAGVGSILSAHQAGHRPVVIPRLKRFSEHVDDHQAELARALEADGQVVVMWEPGSVLEAIAKAGERGSPRTLERTPLHDCLRDALRGRHVS